MKAMGRDASYNAAHLKNSPSDFREFMLWYLSSFNKTFYGADYLT